MILELDRKTSPHPWDEATLVEHLRRREMIGWVSCVGDGDDDDVTGFCVFEMRLDELAVIKWAIDPSFVGCGAELILWNKLVSRSHIHGRLHIAIPDGFRVPVGGVDPHKPLIVESRCG